jgi:titin
LRVDASYRFRVAAENQAGIGAWLTMSEPVPASRPVNRPGPPENLDVTGITSISCLFSWRRPTVDGGAEISGYVIETRKDKETTWHMITETNGRTYNYKLVGLDRDGDYWLRISAVNKAGRGEPAVIDDCIHLRAPATVPDAPQAPLDITPSTSTTLDVKWSPPLSDGGAPLTSYTVMIRDVTRTAWLQAATVGPNETSTTIKDLSTGSEYHVRVMAVNAVGQSEPLQSRAPVRADRPEGSKHAPGPCGMPLTATKVTGTSVTLTWLPPVDNGGSPITDYILWRRDMTGKSWEQMDPVPEFLTEYTLTGLKEGARYMFRVAAKNSAGVGETIQMKEPVHCKKTQGEADKRSTPTQSFDIPEKPGRPGKPFATAVTDDSVTLSWPAPDSFGSSPITNYVIEKREITKSKWSIASKAGTVISCTIEVSTI